jgi:hypothetical protein
MAKRMRLVTRLVLATFCSAISFGQGKPAASPGVHEFPVTFKQGSIKRVQFPNSRCLPTTGGARHCIGWFRIASLIVGIWKSSANRS